MTIDIACHWLHLHTSLLQVKKNILTVQHEKCKTHQNSPKKVVLAILYPILHTQGATSHKFVDPTGNYWMHLYYTDRQTL